MQQSDNLKTKLTTYFILTFTEVDMQYLDACLIKFDFSLRTDHLVWTLNVCLVYKYVNTRHIWMQTFIPSKLELYATPLTTTELTHTTCERSQPQVVLLAAINNVLVELVLLRHCQPTHLWGKGACYLFLLDTNHHPSIIKSYIYCTPEEIRHSQNLDKGSCTVYNYVLETKIMTYWHLFSTKWILGTRRVAQSTTVC